MAVESGNGTLEIDGATTEALGELAARHTIVLHELSSQRASLEEAFMQMTADSVEYHAHSERGAQPPPVGPHWGDQWNRPPGDAPGPGAGGGPGTGQGA